MVTGQYVLGRHERLLSANLRADWLSTSIGLSREVSRLSSDTDWGGQLTFLVVFASTMYSVSMVDSTTVSCLYGLYETAAAANQVR
jgi:hypothetical protein